MYPLPIRLLQTKSLALRCVSARLFSPPSPGKNFVMDSVRGVEAWPADFVADEVVERREKPVLVGPRSGRGNGGRLGSSVECLTRTVPRLGPQNRPLLELFDGATTVGEVSLFTTVCKGNKTRIYIILSISLAYVLK